MQTHVFGRKIRQQLVDEKYSTNPSSIQPYCLIEEEMFVKKIPNRYK